MQRRPDLKHAHTHTETGLVETLSFEAYYGPTTSHSKGWPVASGDHAEGTDGEGRQHGAEAEARLAVVDEHARAREQVRLELGVCKIPALETVDGDAKISSREGVCQQFRARRSTREKEMDILLEMRQTSISI